MAATPHKIRVTVEARDCTWTDWTDKELAHLAWHAAGEKERAKEIHKPFTDDGVTYCGWDLHEGCGEVWPCSTMRARAELDTCAFHGAVQPPPSTAPKSATSPDCTSAKACHERH
jgi:hypothetical protein